MRTAILFEVLKERIENLDSEWIQEILKSYGYKRYLNEHATFRLSLGRQFGHTTLAQKLLKKYENAIVIVPKHAMTKFFDRKCGYRAYPIQSVALRGKNWENNIIIVDAAATCSKADIEELTLNNPKCMIILEE